MEEWRWRQTEAWAGFRFWQWRGALSDFRHLNIDTPRIAILNLVLQLYKQNYH